MKKELESKKAKLSDAKVLSELVQFRDIYEEHLASLRNKHEETFEYLATLIGDTEKQPDGELKAERETVYDASASKLKEEFETVYDGSASKISVTPASFVEHQRSRAASKIMELLSTQEVPTDTYMFPQDFTDTILSFDETSGKLQTLTCTDEQYITYTQFASCHLDACLF